MRKLTKILSVVLIVSLFAFNSISLTTSKTVRADGINPGIQTFVASLYSDCLGRMPDQAGLNDWCTKLANGLITGKQCAYGFFFSAEFQAKANQWSDDELINAYYRVFLNRAADPAGRSYWSDRIANTTNDIGILFTGFADSTEFANKCASYGIVVGNHIEVPVTVRSSASESTFTVTPRTIVFDNLEITFGGVYELTTVQNVFSEYYGQAAVRVPFHIRNLDTMANHLNPYTVTVIGPSGAEVTEVGNLCDMENSIWWVLYDLDPGAEKDCAFYFLYVGDGTYRLDFSAWWTRDTSVSFSIVR